MVLIEYGIQGNHGSHGVWNTGKSGLNKNGQEKVR